MYRKKLMRACLTGMMVVSITASNVAPVFAAEPVAETQQAGETMEVSGEINFADEEEGKYIFVPYKENISVDDFGLSLDVVKKYLPEGYELVDPDAEFLIAGGNFVYAEIRKVAVVSATVTINPSEGYFEGYDGATNLENAGLQNTDYKLGFLPKVQANKGYAFTGWKVTNEAGDVIYTLDTSASEIAFPYGVAGHYTVEAVFEKVPVEVSATVTINPVKGSFEGYDGATNLENAGLQDTDYTLGFLPEVKANKGYVWTGWKVTNGAGEVIYTLDTSATEIAFPYGVAGHYTVEAVFDKVNENTTATVVIDPALGYFEGYDGATELSNENLQDTDYTLGFLPTVVANDGYTFTGWEVTNNAGEVVYTLDATATSIVFPVTADDYIVRATFEKNAVASASATVVIDPALGYFEGYDGATELKNENLQEADYTLGFLPTVVAVDGYTFTGWEVTNSAGEVIYRLDTVASSIIFPMKADDYTVRAMFEKNVAAPVSATVMIDPNEGYFEGYDGASTLNNENLQEADYTLGFLPTVVANDGYTFVGWEVTKQSGEVIYTLDTTATSIVFPYGVSEDYYVKAMFEKAEIPEVPETPETPETPNKPETPETPNKPETPETPDKEETGKENGKKEEAKKENKKENSPKTGDETNAAAAALPAGISLAAILALLVKKFK